ncbi:N-alpha-acetyltransferase 40 [Vespa crabro]|uniref:N-alpha-acetyltransferase 40 n=1 Tax=Vespa crabro TaxID=7445 RepID=UPI001F011257|nr:N-alpha-acetyltransferase 40 [Vespa crabro]
MKRRSKVQKLARAKCIINKANSMKNPFQMIEMYHTYVGKNEYIVNLTCVKAKEASSECRLWVFDIMERNMKNLYEQSSWGWDAIAKQKELTEPTAWYLIASCSNKFIGFSHFRFDIDYKVEVLYCYELQLEESARGKGLGRFMMQALESMASKHKMQKVVLTVLKNNLPALQFFYTLGFKLDNTSPLESEKKDYIILSKQVLIPAS